MRIRIEANRRTAITAALVALALAGVGLIVAGLVHTSNPAAAPLPKVSQPPTALSTVSGAPIVSSGASLPAQLPGPLPTAASSTTSQQPTHQSGLGASSLRIPALGVTASIGVATVDDGVLTPPRVPDVVGLWAGSADLSAKTGEVTIAGHVNWAGMAPFAFGRLAYLQPGDLIYTTDTRGTQTAWRTTSVTARSKTAGVDVSAFAGASGPRKLALITCGGLYVSSDKSYDDNVYVVAVPA